MGEATKNSAQDSGTTIPVTEDVLVVERRTIDAGKVTISKSVDEHQAIVTEPVTHEEVQIERRRVDQPVSADAPPGVRIEGDTTIIPVLEEVLVVEKRLMLREEVRITRVRRESPACQSTTLRREQVEVTRSAAATPVPPRPMKPSPSRSTHEGAAQMNQSVVAVFEDRAQAEDARKELIAGGMPPQRVSLHGDTPGGSVPTSAPGTQIDTETGIGHFFRSLFGLEDDRPDYYEEAARRGHTTLVVDCESEDEIDGVHVILEGYDVIDIDERAAQWNSEAGRTTGDASESAAPMAGRSMADDDAQATIPVVEENLTVGKREVERGRVRVYTRVMERPVEESVQLREERARVSRTPVDRPATEADLGAAFKEGSMEIRERTEVPVVQKQARVVEEVHVGKEVRERTETVRDKVQKTDVRIEEDEAAPAAADGGKPRGAGKPRRS